MTSPQSDQHGPGDKIVELGARGDPRQEHVGELLGAVRTLTLKHACDLVASLLDNVDDTLFDLAEKAESNATQTEYFDGMRETRKKRPRVERLFSERVARGFADFAAGRAPRAQAGQSASAAGAGELSLVDDRELEESLAISSMVAKADTRLSAALNALNQRLSVICGGLAIDDTNNPLGPNALALAFRDALREIDMVDIKVRLIILKMFERYVLNMLDALYHDVNVKLVQAGVLPHLRHPVLHRRPGASARTARTAQAALQNAVSAEAAGAYAAGDEADLHAELMQTLTTLLAARRNVYRGDANQGYGDGPTIASLTPAELLGALTLLQGESRPLPAQPSFVDTRSAVDMVQHLKDELLGQIRRLSGETRARVSGADEDTIDLVGMLFEYILQDHTVPAPMQVLLSRLQIPYLKVAILDRRMFAHASHPARKLLDLLADTAKGWSEESDRDHRLYDKVKGVVESLLADFDDDIGVFERHLGEFSAFVDQNRKRAELAESRATEAARGRERLQEARRKAAQEILSRIEGRALPALLRGVLTRPWANYLVLVLLRQGTESPEFRSAVQFVDDLVATTLVPRDDTERAQLRDAMPSLEKHLRHGLATVAFQEPDVDRLIDELKAFWRQQLGERTAPVAEQPAGAAESVLAITESVQPVIDETHAPEPAEIKPEEVDAGALAAVQALKAGAWVEFIDEQGTRERAKLSWVSPISGKYLFVNRRGLKVADRGGTQLAAELHAGRALILEEVPLFDRALDAIVERLRAAQNERKSQEA